MISTPARTKYRVCIKINNTNHVVFVCNKIKYSKNYWGTNKNLSNNFVTLDFIRQGYFISF